MTKVNCTIRECPHNETDECKAEEIRVSEVKCRNHKNRDDYSYAACSTVRWDYSD